MPERIENLNPNPFIDSPGDYLALIVAEKLALVPQWKLIFGEFIDGYMRMDYGERNLPAMRVYNEKWTMTADNWFIDGDLMVDIILPANVRRGDLQRVPDKLSGALLQQLRRRPFFRLICDAVPGLNYLGQSMTCDKTLAFQMGEASLMPMLQLTVNFRLDLRQWDMFLESDDRTVDDPFVRTLKGLESIATVIRPVDDAGDQAGPDTNALQTIGD